MGWQIKNPPGARRTEEMRALFETSIRQTEVFAKGTSLATVTINGQFHHYMDADTDTMWIGFAIGMRCADRLVKARPAPTPAQGDKSHE
jgi:hypothetical protein